MPFFSQLEVTVLSYAAANWNVDVIFSLVRVQELLKSENHEEGRVPRTVECELAEDLVDSCIPGDVITVTGIIKVINNYMDIGGGIVFAFHYAPRNWLSHSCFRFWNSTWQSSHMI